MPQLEALAKAAEDDLAKGKAEGADQPSIRAFEDFKKKMRRRGDSDKKRAEKLAQRRARSAAHGKTLLPSRKRLCTMQSARSALPLNVWAESTGQVLGHVLIDSPYGVKQP